MLRLNYKDNEGYDRTVEINDGEFTIGRHPSCDLCIADDRLSRNHLIIEKINGIYYADDPGSSNGSRINGRDIYERTELRDGDIVDLGGGAKLSVSVLRQKAVEAVSADDQSMMMTGTFKRPEMMPQTAAERQPAVVSASSQSTGGIPTFVYIAAPFAALMLLVFVGGAVYFLSGNASATSNRSSLDDEDPIVFDDEPKSSKKDPEDVKVTAVNNSGNPSTTTTDVPANISSNVPQEVPASGPTGAIIKVEQSGAAFMRNIASNDPKAFLTGEQATKVNAKIDQLKNSSSLAANINAAKKNWAQLSSLAQSKNLKPQFLTVAAITKLGNNRGDVLQTANTLLPVFEKLQPSIGNEFADDSLLMIAAFEQGKAGQHLKMRNMLQALAEDFSDSSRSIRSIWFLSKHGKITNAEFDSALSFLAIGTIVQNPKEFGVNAESLGS